MIIISVGAPYFWMAVIFPHMMYPDVVEQQGQTDKADPSQSQGQSLLVTDVKSVVLLCPVFCVLWSDVERDLHIMNIWRFVCGVVALND